MLKLSQQHLNGRKENHSERILNQQFYETIKRRPYTIDDLVGILGIHINEINKYLDVLEVKKKIETECLDQGVFYQKRKQIK